MRVKARYCWESIILYNSVRYSLARYTETLFIITVFCTITSSKIVIFKGNLKLGLELIIHVSILFPMPVIVILSLQYHDKNTRTYRIKESQVVSLFSGQL